MSVPWKMRILWYQFISGHVDWNVDYKIPYWQWWHVERPWSSSWSLSLSLWLTFAILFWACGEQSHWLGEGKCLHLYHPLVSPLSRCQHGSKIILLVYERPLKIHEFQNFPNLNQNWQILEELGGYSKFDTKFVWLGCECVDQFILKNWYLVFCVVLTFRPSTSLVSYQNQLNWPPSRVLILYLRIGMGISINH